jgi:hypothetical protein
MNNNKATHIPKYLIIIGWLVSLFAFSLGFYHTADGVSYLQPLGLKYGGFILSGLISLMLVLSYARAVSGVKIALVFYVVCALFNFIFNLNSFYPNMNSRKLLQEEAKQISDTIQDNLNQYQNLINLGSSLDIANLEAKRQACLNEIKTNKGFGDAAKKELKEFNDISQKYGLAPINVGAFDVSTPSAAANFGGLMDSKINDLKNGTSTITNADAALNKMSQLSKMFVRPKGENIMSSADSIFKEISDNPKTKKEDPLAYKRSLEKLEELVKKNDEMAEAVNKLEIKIKNKETGKEQVLKLKVLNPDDKAELLFPKSKEMGKFNHTMDSIGKRIGKLDTWGILILVLFIDFIVPLGIYMLIRKKDGEDKPKKVSFGRDFNS